MITNSYNTPNSDGSSPMPSLPYESDHISRVQNPEVNSFSFGEAESSPHVRRHVKCKESCEVSI